MSEEYIPTGHRIFRGGKRIENEVVATELKPFVIHQPGDEDEDDAAEDVKKRKRLEAAEDAEEEAVAEADSGSPEDIAARIAGDRAQFQADILAVARAEAGEDDEGNPLPDEAEEEQEESE